MRKGTGQSDGVALAQPGFDIDGRAVRPDHAEGFERRVGERIDTEEAEVFAGVIGQGEDALHDGGGRGDAGNFRESGEEGVVERSAHFEVGFAGEEFNAGAKRAVGAVVGDHDRQEDADTEGHAEDVERGEEFVAPGVAQDLPEQDGRPVARHGSVPGTATAASCRARCSSRTS